MALESRRASQQLENSKRGHFRARFKTPKFHEKTPKEKKERKMWRERGKRVRNLGPHPTLRETTLGGTHPSGSPLFGRY